MLFFTVCRSYISHCVSKCVISFCLLNDWLIEVTSPPIAFCTSKDRLLLLASNGITCIIPMLPTVTDVADFMVCVCSTRRWTKTDEPIEMQTAYMCELKEPCTKWECTMAAPGECNWTIHAKWRCSLESNYFDHLLLVIVTASIQHLSLRYQKKRFWFLILTIQ